MSVLSGDRGVCVRTENVDLSVGYHLGISDVVKLFSSCVSERDSPGTIRVASGLIDEQLVRYRRRQVMLFVPTR